VFYLTSILTSCEVAFLPAGVTETFTEQVPFFKVLIPVPATLQMLFEALATVIAYLEPAGDVRFASDNSFDFAVVAPAATE
jgi:hypothetical protein